MKIFAEEYTYWAVNILRKSIVALDFYFNIWILIHIIWKI